MSCVQHSLEGYFVPWGESERAVVPEERLSPSARDTLARLRTLRLFPAGLCACFVAATVARRDAEHLGSAVRLPLTRGDPRERTRANPREAPSCPHHPEALLTPPRRTPISTSLPFPSPQALALLQTGMLARTSSAPEGRTLAHVAHARGATLLFLALAVGKSYALLLVRRETCLVLRTRPCDALEWVSLACVACFAYVSYVASLAYQRLIHAYLIATFVRNPDERAESGDAPACERER